MPRWFPSERVPGLRHDAKRVTAAATGSVLIGAIKQIPASVQRTLIGLLQRLESSGQSAARRSRHRHVNQQSARLARCFAAGGP